MKTVVEQLTEKHLNLPHITVTEYEIEGELERETAEINRLDDPVQDQVREDKVMREASSVCWEKM